MLEKIDSALFDWLLWRNGTPMEIIGVRHCKTDDLLRFRYYLRELAVGYCEGELVPCRPKINTKAVLFFVNGKHFWFHISDFEFYSIFE